MGVGLTVLSFFIKSTFLSAIVAVFAFSSFRSIKELVRAGAEGKKGLVSRQPQKEKSPRTKAGGRAGSREFVNVL